MNLYAILGVPPDADEERIHSAYRALARRYHPDRGAGSSPEKFRQVSEAYETLSDPERRRAHDLLLPPARPPATARVEPMMAPPEPFRQQSPDVFGQFERPPSAFDALFEAWLRAIEDRFFSGTVWPW